VENLEDGLENEVVEGALNVIGSGGGPFLGLWVEPVVTLTVLLAESLLPLHILNVPKAST
jgi:hypothetical protein